MIVFPNAKINIGLRIVDKRNDGYHDLETIFYPLRTLRDILEFHESPDGCTRLTNFGAQVDCDSNKNLVVRAVELLRKDFDFPPLEILLYKHIPFGAGLGGGSADCSFTIKYINEQYGLGLDKNRMAEYASRLGADCAFFIENRPMLASGIGEILKPIDVPLAGKHILVVKPDICVPTNIAFRQIKTYTPHPQLEEKASLPFDQWREHLTNDFEKPIFEAYPELRQIKEKIYGLGAIYASMSGSGSALYGIFDEEPTCRDNLFSGCFVWHDRL